MNLKQYEYYRTDLGVLYCGDCLEIMPQLEPVDLVLTDPLYPNMKGNIKHLSGGVAKRRNQSITVGHDYSTNLKWIPMADKLSSKAIMIFCSYHFIDEIPQFLNGKRIILITWHKRNANNSVCNAPRYTTEFIWVFQNNAGLNWRALKTSMFDIPNLSAGCVSTGERVTKEDGTAAHPMQKPTSLIIDLLSVGGESVLDCHIGTGTTAIACERLNRRWTGIEIEEKYCAIAKKRIEQERKQRKLF